LTFEDRVECVSSVGDAIYIGTATGNVIHVALERPSHVESERPPVQASQIAVARLSQRRPVEHICAAEGFVLTIADGVCYALTASDIMAPPEILGRDARCVCSHTGQRETMQAEFCVSFRKKLVLFTRAEQGFEILQEFPTSDVACALVWHHAWICAGFKKEYSLYSDRAGVPQDICTLDGKTTPRIALVGDSELLLMIQEAVGFFFDLNTRQPASKSTVTWPRKVVAMGATSSYILGSSGSGQVDVFSVRDQRACQTLVTECSACAICPCAVGSAIVAGGNSVVRLELVPFERQIRRLLLQARVSEALDLLNATFGPGDPRREQQLSRLHLQAGWMRFSELQFMQAFTHFMYSADFSVAEVLGFWRRLLPTGLDMASVSEGACLASDSGAPEPCDVEDFVRARLLERQEPASASAVSANVGLANGALVLLLLRQREALQALERSPQERRKGVADPAHVLRAVDTVLLKILIQTEEDDTRLQQVLRSGARCCVDDMEAFLRQHQRPDVLAHLWKRQGRFDMALKEWAALLSGAAAASASVSALVGAMGAAPISPKVVAAEMAGALRSALGSPGSDDLCRAYVPKLLAVDAPAALPIFVGAPCKCPLAPDEVLSLLEGHGALVRAYLQHLVGQREGEPRHRLQLARLYLAEIAEERRRGEAEAALGPTRRLLLDFLEEAEGLDFGAVLPQLEELCLYQETVVLHSRESRHREALRVLVERLSDLPRAEAYCRIVMARRRPTAEAWGISVLCPDPPAWAKGVVFGARRGGEATAWQPSDPKQPRPLLLFLEALLAACGAAERQPLDYKRTAAEYKDAAIALLTGYVGHGDLPPHEVIGMLPESWPLHGLAPYLAKCARMCLHQRRAGMLEESLSSMAYLKTFGAWASERTRKVTITTERACPRCNRRFVDKDAVSKAFVAYPNGTCVHLQCKDDLSICPRTGRCFADNLSVFCNALGP